MMKKESKIKTLIEEKIEKNFPNDKFKVVDVSLKHKKHPQNIFSQESHFVIQIISEKFLSLSALDRQKLVLKVLGDEIINKTHSISMNLKLPKIN